MLIYVVFIFLYYDIIVTVDVAAGKVPSAATATAASQTLRMIWTSVLKRRRNWLSPS